MTVQAFRAEMRRRYYDDDGSGCFHKCCLVFLLLLGLSLGAAGISFLARSGTSDRTLVPAYNDVVDQWNATYYAIFHSLDISAAIQPGRQNSVACTEKLCPRSTVVMERIEGNSELLDPLKKYEIGHSDRKRYTASHFSTKGRMPEVLLDDDVRAVHTHPTRARTHARACVPVRLSACMCACGWRAGVRTGRRTCLHACKVRACVLACSLAGGRAGGRGYTALRACVHACMRACVHACTGA